MARLFYNIYKTFAAKKIFGLVTLLIVLSILVFAALQIKFEEDITKLIPTNDKTIDAQKVLKTVNFADKIIVNIKREESGSIDDLTAYASEFIDSISSNSESYISKIQGRVDDEDVLQTLDFVYANLPLFLDSSDYKTIAYKLNSDSLRKITNQNYKTLVSPSGVVAKNSILKDPLGLSFLALKKLEKLSFGNDFTLHNGFLLSRDKKHILLFISPTLESSETAENSKFAENLYATNAALNAKFKGKVGSEYFGGLLVAVANAKQIKTDIQFTVGIALTILLIILIFFYKKLSIPIILFVPTIIGGLLAVAVLFIIRTKISAISLGIGSVLLGVTLDYSLHILTHIRSNNNVKALYHEITKPILMSSITTALAFLCLLFLDSQALQDLGMFAAISVLGASVFALLFIPQVYTESIKSQAKNTPIDRLANYSFHKKKWLVVALILLLFGSLFTYNNVIFNKDIAKLNYEPKALKDAHDRLDALTNIASKSVYLAAYGNSQDEALQTNEIIQKQLESFKTDEDIVDFSSIASLVQSTENQNEKIQIWKSFWTNEQINNTKTNLIDAGKSYGFKSTTFNAFYELLNKTFTPLELKDYKALESIPVEDYITTKDDFTTATSLVKVSPENHEKIVTTFKGQNNIVVIDRQAMNETFLGNLKNDFNRLVGYSFIAVLLILLIFYRSTSLTFVTIIPIALTWLLTIGIMGLLKIEFNIFNIIISTFIFGLGIDYSIFITNGLLQEYRTGEKAVSVFKTSILLSLITTILGVGVLIFAKHPALYTISLVSIIGILSAVIISFTLQPLLFYLLIGSKTKRPITLRLLLHSLFSFTYYGLGGFLLSVFSVSLMKIIPLSKKVKMKWFHKTLSKFMKSVLYTNPFVKKTVINSSNETFEKQAIIVANHTSFLDILAIGMLHPKIIFLVNDWVYNSPIFGKAVRAAGFYPVTSGIENGVTHLQKKVDQGYSLMAFPEGTRSTTNKIKRFHKGAFFLAESFNLDIVPVLIHGNSEVNPKGSFVIEDGSITVQILDRISTKDATFGDTYKDRTKKISAYFRSKFNALRHEIEDSTYFHNILLDDYRYKGDDIYKRVKQDLKENHLNYYQIINEVNSKDTIIHVSEGDGQLDFLLSLDGPDRKVHSYIETKETRKTLKNSFITNKYKKLCFINDINEAHFSSANAAILNSKLLTVEHLKTIVDSEIKTCVLLNESCNLYAETLRAANFKIHHNKNGLIILKK